jgi:hypothetical protein
LFVVRTKNAAEPLSERHVLPERDEPHLVVAIDEVPRAVEQEHARMLRAVRVVEDGSRQRGSPHVGNRISDRLYGRAIADGPRVQGPLPPDREIGWVGFELAVQVDVHRRDRDVLCLARQVLRSAYVHLERCDVDGRPVGLRCGDGSGSHDQDNTRDHEDRG